MTVWIVGRSFWRLDPEGWSWTWDLHGIFRRQVNAEALCQDGNWWIAPVKIDEPLPEEPHEFVGTVVPKKNTAKPLEHCP